MSNSNIKRLQESFVNYRSREMDETELSAADKLTAMSVPMGLFEWKCTDGEIYAKGCNAVSHQVALDSRA